MSMYFIFVNESQVLELLGHNSQMTFPAFPHDGYLGSPVMQNSGSSRIYCGVIPQSINSKA